MKTKTSYDKKQNVGMIALFIFSITLTAGLTARLTKKANDNADKINQVTDDLSNIENLVKQDKAVKLYENENVTDMDSPDAMIDLPLSVLNDYTMLYVNIHVDEGYLDEYILTKSLTFNNDVEQIFMLNGDYCGGNPAKNELFGAIIYLSKKDSETLHLEFFQVYINQESFTFDNRLETFKHDGDNVQHDTGIGVFNLIYGIK